MPGRRDGRGLMVCLAIAVFAGPAAAERVDYTGYQVVRVEVNTAADLGRVEDLSAHILNDYVGITLLDAVIAPDRMDDLAESGLFYKVLSDDIGPASSRHLYRSPFRGEFDDYLTFSEMVTFMNYLVTIRPDLCEMIDIGDSVENRDIWVLHITGPTPDPKPAVFYEATIHAREWISAPVVLFLADRLVNQYDTDPCIQGLVDRTHFYLAPCVNPDGYVYSWDVERLWRKNRSDNGGGIYGVDLNRNWAEGWGGPGSSADPDSELYRGPYAFSEPETVALSQFIISNPAINTFMDYHSYGQLVMWPYGYTSAEPPEPDRSTFYMVGGEMQRLIQDVHGETYGAGPIHSTLYPASGVTVDWVYGDQGRFAFTIELRSRTAIPGVELPPDQIIPTCEESLPGILFLSEWAANDAVFILPDGAPARISAGQDTVVAVDIIPSASVAAGTAELVYRYDTSGPFIHAPLVHLGEDSYQAVLPATNCTSTPEFYFVAQSTGGQTVTNPCGAPGNTYGAEVVAPPFFDEPLDVDPGWSTEGLWAFGQPTGGGGEHGSPDPTSGHTGLNVYGYNLSGDYENGLDPERHLTSPAIDCTGQFGVLLSFWRWLGVEQPPYDHAYVRVSNNGLNWITIWENTDEVADSEWTYQEFDISSVADDQPTVYLRWTMGTTDDAWPYCGWNIDDIQLVAPGCPVTPGDYDGDGDIDLDDFAAFADCMTGPGGVMNPGCGIFDFVVDRALDLADFAMFQTAFGT
ncbi:MAG: hypothetical protein JSV19_01540 [Phycisphaerales bacterium]|nr:MAG: hypothetical protein JSV19_01540 [Phycisphaerales bacterium]